MLATCLLACTLAGCAPQGSRMVNAVDDSAFTVLSRSMQVEMRKRHLVDDQGSWYSPVVSFGPFNAGEKLVNRLSPAFRFPRAGVSLPKTFREFLGEDAHVSLQGPKAILEQGLSRIELRLVAVADWNGDDKDDWLIVCRVSSVETPKKFRDYYLVIQDLKRPVWDAELLMILDHVYGKVRSVGDPAHGDLAESLATDYLQGQATILESPDQSALKRSSRKISGVRESSLKN